MQGVIKSYDPGTGDGTVLCDTDLREYELADGALTGSVFRMLRQGQRVVYDLDTDGRAGALRLGSEVDMGTPGFGELGVDPDAGTAAAQGADATAADSAANDHTPHEHDESEADT